MDTITPYLKKVKNASEKLLHLSDQEINAILLSLAKKIPDYAETILSANKADLLRMEKEDPRYDRLLLNEKRLESIAKDIVNVASLKSPLDRILESRTLDNGLEISRVTVPFGVIGIIYEARPNVTFDVFSLCLKAKSAVVLKGGSDAEHSNQAIVSLIQDVLKEHNVDPNTVHLLPSSHQAVEELLKANDTIDVIIPRGSKKLIDFVREFARVPIIETGAGIVHTYVDSEVDIEQAISIIFNAKTRRVSVCNALDTLIIHEHLLPKLYQLLEKLAKKNVQIFADDPSWEVLQGKYPNDLLTREAVFGQEFLSYKMAIKTVKTLQEAIDHITKYSSKHSEAILSTNQEHIDYFLKTVDAAVVYANASTAFTDGAQFGLGAEIGISTQKLHARGPMALRELTSYKWVVLGHGQIRPN